MEQKFTRRKATMNITPLIDVMFILLLFVLITTRFDDPSPEEGQTDVDLTEIADGESTDTPPEAIRIVITLDGTVFVDDAKISEAGLVALFNETAEKAPESIIEFSLDANLPTHLTIKAVAAARRAGLSKISFHTKTSNAK